MTAIETSRIGVLKGKNPRRDEYKVGEEIVRSALKCVRYYC